MDSPWTALSHMPGRTQRVPKTMSPAEMLAPLPKEDTRGAADEWAASVAAAEAAERSNRSNAGSGSGSGGGGQTEGDGSSPRPRSPPKYIEHAVAKSDTLFGLSLKYGVSVSELKRANDLVTDNLATTKVLRVPVAAGAKHAFLPRSVDEKKESERAAMRRFRVTHDVSEAEAKYYLSAHDYDYDRATEELRRDLDFERKNGGLGEAAVRVALAKAEVKGMAAAAAAGGGGDAVRSGTGGAGVREWGARDVRRGNAAEAKGFLGGAGAEEREEGGGEVEMMVGRAEGIGAPGSRDGGGGGGGELRKRK